MNCNDVNDILNGHRLASLGAAERAHLDTHVDRCAACAASVAAYERLRAESFAGPRAGLFEAIYAALPPARPVARPESRQAARPESRPAARRPAPPAASAPSANRPAMPWSAVAGTVAVAALLLIVTLGVVFEGSGGQPALPSQADASGEPPRISILAGTRGAESVLAGQPGSAERAPAPGPATVPFVEGEHYFAVPNPSLVPGVGDRISVWIFYLWSCLHCYALEAELAEWMAAVETEGVDVARVPVQWNPLAELHARAFYAAQRLGVDDEISQAFFASVHERGILLDSREAIADVFVSSGIGQAEFAAVFDSAGVDGMLERGRSLAAAFGIDATPTIVVGDAYKTTPVATGSPEQTFAVVDWLIAALERGVVRAQQP